MTRTVLLSATLVALLAGIARADKPAAPSPTLDVLAQEAAKNPSGQPTHEGASTDAGTAFSGQGADGGAVQAPAGVPTYHFEGTSPVKGINLYTPVRDTSPNDSTQTPKKKDYISPKLTWGLMGGGAAGVVGGIGLMAALAPHLMWIGAAVLGVGALALGAGLALWLVNRRLSK